MTSSADAVLPILADDVDLTVATMMETMSSPQQQAVVPRMDNEGLSKLFGMRSSGAKHNGKNLSFRKILELAGLTSMRGIQKLYKEWEDSALFICDRVVRRQECAGNGKVFLDEVAENKCKAEIVKFTIQLGGMLFEKFKEFITPYVRETISRWARAPANWEHMDLSGVFTIGVWSANYFKLLPELVRKGDRALLRRLNKRNDILVWITHFVMLIVACMGSDGRLYPLTEDLTTVTPQTSSNFDTFVMLLEGGEFEKQAFLDKIRVVDMEAVMNRYAPTVTIKGMHKPALKDELTQRIDGFPLVPQPEPVTPNPVTTSNPSSSVLPAISTTGKKQPAKRKSTMNGDEGNVSLPPLPRKSGSGRTINTPTKFTS